MTDWGSDDVKESAAVIKQSGDQAYLAKLEEQADASTAKPTRMSSVDQIAQAVQKAKASGSIRRSSAEQIATAVAQAEETDNVGTPPVTSPV